MADEVDPVNIGNPGETSILEFAEEIVAMTDTSSKIVFKPLPKDDPKVRQPNIAKAKSSRSSTGREPTRTTRSPGFSPSRAAGLLAETWAMETPSPSRNGSNERSALATVV